MIEVVLRYVLFFVFCAGLAVGVGGVLSAVLSRDKRALKLRIAAVGFAISGVLGMLSIGIVFFGCAILCLYASLSPRIAGS